MTEEDVLVTLRDAKFMSRQLTPHTAAIDQAPHRAKPPGLGSTQEPRALSTTSAASDQTMTAMPSPTRCGSGKLGVSASQAAWPNGAPRASVRLETA